MKTARTTGVALLLTCVFGIIGCGRYMPPIPPEQLAPNEVQDAKTTYDEKGSLTFEWSAPRDDLRGKKLKQISGYVVSRWTPKSQLEMTDQLTSLAFVELAYLQDNHLVELKKLTDEAEERGEVTRKVRVKEELKRFSWQDKAVPEGTSYYKITPINDIGGSGKVKDLYKVVRKGTMISVTNLPYTLDALKSK